MYEEGASIKEYKENGLTRLVSDLLQKNPQNRLGTCIAIKGHKNDYYEVLGHEYFKGLNKKEFATQTCEPLKSFSR